MSRTATWQDVIEGRARWCVVNEKNDAILASLAEAGVMVDVTITDPPYNERTHKGARAKGGKLVADTTVKFEKLGGMEWWEQSLRVTRRWNLAFCAPEQLGGYEASSGDAWIRSGVWVRIGAAPQFTGDRPAAGADTIAIAHRVGRKRWNGGGRCAVWQYGFAHEEMGATRYHETQKPEALMRELVRLFSDPGEVIGDWFAGSGTTGEAALKEGRRVILVEQNPVHAETCRERCDAAERGTSVVAMRAGQLGLFRGGR